MPASLGGPALGDMQLLVQVDGLGCHRLPWLNRMRWVVGPDLREASKKAAQSSAKKGRGCKDAHCVKKLDLSCTGP